MYSPISYKLVDNRS